MNTKRRKPAASTEEMKADFQAALMAIKKVKEHLSATGWNRVLDGDEEFESSADYLEVGLQRAIEEMEEEA